MAHGRWRQATAQQWVKVSLVYTKAGEGEKRKSGEHRREKGLVLIWDSEQFCVHTRWIQSYFRFIKILCSPENPLQGTAQGTGYSTALGTGYSTGWREYHSYCYMSGNVTEKPSGPGAMSFSATLLTIHHCAFLITGTDLFSSQQSWPMVGEEQVEPDWGGSTTKGHW